MAVVLAVLCGLAAAYCLLRCVVPRWRSTDHGIGVDAWHVVMGAAMGLMFLGGGQSELQAWLFAAGAIWCVWSLMFSHGGGAHLRLGAALAAMTLMLMPSPAAAVPPGHEHHQHVHAGASTGLGPIVGAALVVAAVAVVVAAVLAVRSARDGRARVGLVCEVSMAAAMGWMTATAL